MSYKPRYNRRDRDDDSEEEQEEKRTAVGAAISKRLGLSEHWRAKQLEPAPDGSYRPSKTEFVKYVCASPSRTFGVQAATPVAWMPSGRSYAFVSGSHSIYMNCLLPPNSPEGVSRVDRILHAHTARVTSLLFHPREPYLISAGDDCIVVWDTNTGKVVQKIVHKQGRRCHDGGVECMTWACNNQVLITGSRDTTFILWRFVPSPTARLEFLEQITGHKGTVLALVYHQESARVVSAGRDSTIKVWDCSGLENLLRENALALVEDLAAAEGSAKGAATSPTAAGVDADAKAAEDADDAEKERSKKLKANVNKITLVANLEGHRGDVLQLRFLQKGRLLVSGARDNTMKLWDLARNCHLRDLSALNPHRGDIVAITPLLDERKLFTASGDGTVKLWELGQEELADLDDRKLETDVLGMLKREVAMLIEGDDDATTSNLSDFGSKSSGGSLFHQKHVDRVLSSQTIHEVVHAVSLNPTLPLMLSSASKNELRVWDVTNLAEPRLIQQFVGHEGEVTGLALSKDGKVIVSSSVDWSCLKYSMETLTLLSAIRYSASIMAMSATPDCRTVFLAGSDYTPRAYDTAFATNSEIMRFTGHSGRVRSCALSHDGKVFATGAQDFNFCLYDLAAGPSSSTIRTKHRAGDDAEANTAFLSATTPRNDLSGQYPPTPLALNDLAAGGAPAALARFNAKETIQPGSGHVFALAFAPAEVCPEAGKYLLAVGTGDHAVRVYRLRGASASLAWTGDTQHTSVVTALAWGRGVSAGLLFSASWDRTVRVWRAGPNQKSAELVRTLGGPGPVEPNPGHLNKISQLAVSLDGAYLISVSYDQTAIVWDLQSGQYTPVAKYATVTNDGAFTAVVVGEKHVFIGTETGMLYEFPLFSPETIDKFMNVPQMLSEQEQQLLQSQDLSSDQKDAPIAMHLAPATADGGSSSQAATSTAQPHYGRAPSGYTQVNVAPAPLANK